jgi:hypothetical protein
MSRTKRGANQGWAYPLCVLLCALASASLGRVADAQTISEADRQGARDLWQEGYQLQQAGQYAQALDKFKRAQAIFSAPTNLLHIAECEAQLGQLVESAETYRQLISLTLPPGAPPAFAAAQTQGKAELQQVEARIPKVRIEVTPANVPNLAVAIDNQPLNIAFVGVDRPIDPGTHKVAVGASGFLAAEKTIVVKEKEPPQVVSFALQQGAMVLPQPGLAPPPPMGGYPQGTVIYTQPYGVPVVQPYVIQPRTYVAPRKKDYTTTGFLLGGRVGAAVPTGTLATGGVSTGFGGDLEGYFRFAHKWLVGLYGGHDFYTLSSGTAGSSDIGASIGLSTNPEGVGFMIDLTLGYRSYSGPTGVIVNAGAGNSTEFTSGTAGSVEGGIGLGVWIAIGKHVRLVPRVDVFAGSFNKDGLGSYANFFAGISLYYNNDIKPKAEAVAPTSPGAMPPGPPGSPAEAPAAPAPGAAPAPVAAPAP